MAKKIPLRQCLGCRTMNPKDKLVRVVKSPSGEIHFDKQGKMPGRGAYLCKEESCLKKAMKSKALERAFSTSISSEVYDELVIISESLLQEDVNYE